ncbi:MAG: leucine-rich repeat protein [Oscillospiraceae bacterium]|jgi:uncharacterized CHY-type Zn-finger protein|nr:leucine-rich repeat protein [Oscillospiraceae bacterium]
MIDITEIRCPHCKGTVTLNKQRNVAVCEYCGKTVAVDGLPKPPAPTDYYPFVVNSEGVLTGYLGAGGQVKIPEGVKIIWQGAFANRSNIGLLQFPKTLEIIGQGAFASCTGLTRVFIPGNVKIIGTQAFEGCLNLTSIVLCEGVEQINDRTFKGCAISSILIPKSVKLLNSYAFLGCKNLVHIELMGSVMLSHNDIVADSAYKRWQGAQWVKQGGLCALCKGAVTAGSYVCSRCGRPLIV